MNKGDATRRTALYLAFGLLGLLSGLLSCFLALEIPLFGLLFALGLGALLFKRAGVAKWTTLGSFLLGIGFLGYILLSPALYNKDPAVIWDPSSIPFLIIVMIIGFIGLIFVISGTAKAFKTVRNS